jgi:hypothetical protein
MFEDSGEDWLSRTIRMVEAVMQQHGFQEDPTPRVACAAVQVSVPKVSSLSRLLRALLPSQP